MRNRISGRKAGLPREQIRDATSYFELNKFQKKRNGVTRSSTEDDESWKPGIIWLNVFFITLFHILALYAFIFRILDVRIYTVIWCAYLTRKSFESRHYRHGIVTAIVVLFSFPAAITVGGIAGFGITAGVHRLWAHRSYKARLPLKIILLLCYSMAGQVRLSPLISFVRRERD